MEAVTTLTIIKAASAIVALLIAIIGHEIMHGAVALYYGDKTAKEEGRLSINPLKHIDPIGSVVLPALLLISGAPFLFGWAKPVPVYMPTVIRHGGYKGAIAVSLAGIVFNLLTAIVVAMVFSPFSASASLLEAFMTLLAYNLVLYSVVLAVFNLWPIPPLDGSNALGYTALALGNHTIPAFFNKIERFGMVLLLIIIMTPLSKVFFLPVEILFHFLTR